MTKHMYHKPSSYTLYIVFTATVLTFFGEEKQTS